MKRSGNYRGLASLALLHLSESDLRALHATVSEMSPSSFLELIRSIEVEVTHAKSLALERVVGHEHFASGSVQLYQEIDRIRRNQLRVSVQSFVEMMVDGLSQVSRNRGVEIPRFEARRGLKVWIARLLQTFSEQEVFHAAARIRRNAAQQGNHDWKLK
ncbi:MAG: hypothetical protein OXC26_08830 [Albidovulum sp.]|nr:hypothetical protein [Albidovulum sp.]